MKTYAKKLSEETQKYLRYASILLSKKCSNYIEIFKIFGVNFATIGGCCRLHRNIVCDNLKNKEKMC